MKRWMKYVKPYKWYFILGPLCMIIEVVGEVVMPKFLASIINTGIADKSVGYVLMICAFMVVTALLMMAGGVGGAYFGAKAAVGFATDLRKDVYGKVQEFSFANIDKFSTGSLVTRLTNDITQIQNFINMLLRMCLRAPGMLIGALIMAILLSPSLSVIFAVAMPVILITLLFVISKGYPRFSKMQTKIDALNSNVQENLTNVRVVKSFVREDYERQKFGTSNHNLRKATTSAMTVMITMMPLMMLFMNLTTIAVLWFGGNQVIAGGMPVGDLTAFVTYITQILISLMMVVMMFMTSSRALASANRVVEVLDEEPDLNDFHAAHKDAEIQNGKIEFRNVDFKYYKTSQDKVLENISLTIEPGETVGIIGSTGCGKSTLVSLIPRLYDADSGEVLIDGIDVRDYDLKKLRQGIGMVLQKNVLFSGTLEENMRWGKEDATMEEIEENAGYAQADLFIKGFTDQYQTELGQGGVNLSGGQKQRVCIARALIKNPKIIILDDSTSAVDTATEAKIREAFSTNLKHSTKIIIAQRITSVSGADKIVVLDEGKICGVGTHKELLASNEEYQEIYYSQNEKKEANA
ncbi:ABC transporter transmembrane domain-containing protein [Congzhengia minquanensis]|uniref:ABC transporter ATP-binding protein n=1 Tax=Congzhengia minquanensis TaxID=2763657 RepID=A0A926DMB8_9FIRM|nr:ABC transporter ATP-binding protein [Congzhengia minquanensis]